MARELGVSPTVLVTGATGFVGGAVARRLLETGRPLMILARPRDGVSAAARAAAAIGTTPDDPRVGVVEGDLAEPGCGLDAAGWRRLRGSVDTVIHCAGDTAFAPTRLEPYEHAHVSGPCRLLERLASGRLRRWVHVSTAYVCGRRTGVVLESEDDVGQTFHNVYERVKLASEAALRAAGRAAAVDVAVARPSVVVGRAPATSGGTPANLLLDVIRLVAGLAGVERNGDLLRIEAAPGAPFNVVPVDYVAAALVHLAGSPGADGETIHLVAHEAPTQAAVLATIGERLGVRGLSLVDRLDRPTPIERRVAFMLRGYREYLTQRIVFDDRVARRTLPAEIRGRAALSGDALHALIGLALATRPATPSAAARSLPTSA